MGLKLAGLTKKYGDKVAVNQFSTSLEEGIYGLLGANGSGKTTLLKMTADILKPTAGEVFYEGRKIEEMGEDYRDILGYLPQDFGYYPDFKAEDLLMYIASIKGLSKKIAKERTLRVLEIVGLIEEKDKKIKTFSGGMKQRLGIAQILLNDPKVLLLDEPTAGLDPKERVNFRNFLSSFSSTKIIIYSTHIVSDIESIADEIIIMKEGQMLHKDKIKNISESIAGSVWTCSVSKKRADSLKNKYIVNEAKKNGEDLDLRIIAEEKPCREAVYVRPNLEDVYLYYFKGGLKNERDD